MARLSTELHHYFFEEVQTPQVTLKEILSLSGERTFGFLFVLLSLPVSPAGARTRLFSSLWDRDAAASGTAHYGANPPLGT